MRAIFLLTLLCFLLPFLAVAKKDIPLKYDIICAGSGNAGASLVKVSVYVDKANITTDIIKKAAVHGLIFKGYNDSRWGRKRPLAKSATVEQEHVDFFSVFFQNNGAYLNYADMVDGGMQTVKVDKKEYKVTAIVSVADDEIKRVLEDAGIVKKMASGF